MYILDFYLIQTHYSVFFLIGATYASPPQIQFIITIVTVFIIIIIIHMSSINGEHVWIFVELP